MHPLFHRLYYCTNVNTGHHVISQITELCTCTICYIGSSSFFGLEGQQYLFNHLLTQRHRLHTNPWGHLAVMPPFNAKHDVFEAKLMNKYFYLLHYGRDGWLWEHLTMSPWWQWGTCVFDLYLDWTLTKAHPVCHTCGHSVSATWSVLSMPMLYLLPYSDRRKARQPFLLARMASWSATLGMWMTCYLMWVTWCCKRNLLLQSSGNDLMLSWHPFYGLFRISRKLGAMNVAWEWIIKGGVL